MIIFAQEFNNYKNKTNNEKEPVTDAGRHPYHQRHDSDYIVLGEQRRQPGAHPE